jgi:hypothetical protein
VFTLDRANSAIPLVRRVVADIVQIYRQMALVQQRLASDAVDPQEKEMLDSTTDQQETRLSALVSELTDIGCELKDANIGLVDFIGRHDGRDIYLCWRLGEDRIQFWHELHAGFAGRQPIATLRE